jgi:hypothetical protein
VFADSGGGQDLPQDLALPDLIQKNSIGVRRIFNKRGMGRYDDAAGTFGRG